MTYPREIIISTQLLREHQLSHILQGCAFMLSYTLHPAPFPQHVLSPDPNLAWPKMLFVKINFQIRRSQCTWQGGKELKLEGREWIQDAERGICSLEQGFSGQGSGHSSAAAGHKQHSQACCHFCHSILEHHVVPKSLLASRVRAFPMLVPRP